MTRLKLFLSEDSSKQFGVMRIVGLLGLQPFFGGEERTESEVRLTKVPGRMDRILEGLSAVGGG